MEAVDILIDINRFLYYILYHTSSGVVGCISGGIG